MATIVTSESEEHGQQTESQTYLPVVDQRSTLSKSRLPAVKTNSLTTTEAVECFQLCWLGVQHVVARKLCLNKLLTFLIDIKADPQWQE